MGTSWPALLFSFEPPRAIFSPSGAQRVLREAWNPRGQEAGKPEVLRLGEHLQKLCPVFSGDRGADAGDIQQFVVV